MVCGALCKQADEIFVSKNMLSNSGKDAVCSGEQSRVPQELLADMMVPMHVKFKTLNSSA